jgi:hypothetical protein
VFEKMQVCGVRVRTPAFFAILLSQLKAWGRDGSSMG